MTEPKVTVKVVCGCGMTYETSKESSVGATIREAKTHADIHRHTMEVRGEIRVDK